MHDEELFTYFKVFLMVTAHTNNILEQQKHN